jgi:hypothetical protein
MVSCSSTSPASTVPAQPTLMDRIAAAEARLTSVENVANQASTKATNAESSVKNIPDIASLKSDISQLKSDLASLKTQISTPNPDIVSIKTQLADLTTKVTDLSVKLNAHLVASPTPTSNDTNSEADTTVTNEKISVTIKDLGSMIPTGSANFDSEDTIKLSITNSNTTSISSLRLYIYMTPDSNVSKSLIDVPLALGGDISCVNISSSPDEFIFKTGKITVSASKTKTFYLTPTITLLPKAYYRYVNPDLVYSDNSSAPNKINTAYLSDDINFDETVEIIDYNVD